MIQYGKPYKILIVATMSAGKTSVVNSLIGQELLHSANEATTATIMQIQNKDKNSYFWATPYSYDNRALFARRKVDSAVLKEWNANNDVKVIDLSGPFRLIKNSKFKKLVIYDTPGPNNSMDAEHNKLTQEALTFTDYQMVIYVINATQIGVNDDKALLESVKKTLKPNQEIIFLLNKSDQFDEEKGESIYTAVGDVEKYLTNLGFDNPKIIPTSANNCLSLQKAIYKDKLTRSDKANISCFMDMLNDNFILASNLPQRIKSKVLKEKFNQKYGKSVEISSQSYSINELKKAVSRTGFGLLSTVIKEYL